MTRPHSRALLGILTIGLVLAGLLGAALPASAQLDDAEIEILSIDTSAYPEVELLVNVPRVFADTELTTGAFAVSEGGVGRTIRVESVDDAPAVVLAIDTSGSMAGEPLTAAKLAAFRFLEGLPAGATVSVVGFGSTATVASPPTDDLAAVSPAIDGLFSDGETALYDGLVQSADVLAATPNPQRIVVLLSDGADTASAASLDAAAASLSDAGALLYAVALQTGDTDTTGLAELTTRVGGRLASLDSVDQLTDAYDAIAARIANQYRVSFSATSSGPVEVIVSVTSGGALAAATTVTELSAAADVGGIDTPSSSVAIDMPPPTEYVGSPGMFDSNLLFYAGIAGVGVAIALLAWTFFTLSARSRAMRNAIRAARAETARRGVLNNLANRATATADHFLNQRQKRRAVNDALDRAGIDLRPGEFLVVSALVALSGAGLLWVMIHPIAGVVGGVALTFGARGFVAFKGKRRQGKFASQLDNTLSVMASALRAGHGVQRALAAVAEESPSPTQEEFSRVVAETRIGRDLIEALEAVGERLGNEDFTWVVRGISINRELGGNLSEVLENVAETIRERNELRGQVKALSAEGRLSAMILFCLPFGIAGFVRTTNPEYLGELTQSTAGWVAVVVSIVLMGVGGLWIKKIIKVRF
ncbi:MAG: type II secretion system F family protein [Acidimicrobiales bacterium]|nr:type II secretion system F family protein [Acidimicrobiales bacterium]